MSIKDAYPDMGACSGIPDMGAWQFVIPDKITGGAFRSEPQTTGDVHAEPVATARLNSRPVLESPFGSVQA